MGYLGAVVGFWLLYALIAIFAKHKVSIIIMTVIGVVGGIVTAIYGSSFALLVGTVIGAPIILICPPIQIKSVAKDKWKERRKRK